MEVIARGILVGPTQITIGSEGYKDTIVTLDWTTEEFIRGPMVREKVEPGDETKPR